MTRLKTCLGVLVPVFLATPAAAEDRRIVTGKAQVLTLDTLKVGDKIVDLKWIEPLPDYRSRSPYLHRDFKSIPKRFPHPDIRSVPIRSTAINALGNRIGSETVTCKVEVRKLLVTFVKTREDYERTCYLGDSTKGLDLNGWLVRQGMGQNRPPGVCQALPAGRKGCQDKATGGLVIHEEIPLVLRRLGPGGLRAHGR